MIVYGPITLGNAYSAAMRGALPDKEVYQDSE
jgi:hypothetical protein